MTAVRRGATLPPHAGRPGGVHKMAEFKLGSKHECPSCSTKFYDLGKAKPVCPSCGAQPANEREESTESKAPASHGEEE